MRTHYELTVSGKTVTERCVTADGTETTIHECYTGRVAQVLAARLALENAGWRVYSPCSGHKMRKPLLLPGERMHQPLDGSLSDERAQGFEANFGGYTYNLPAAILIVDACAGMPWHILVESGDRKITAEAIAIISKYLA